MKYCTKKIWIFSALQSKIDTFAISVDTDETARSTLFAILFFMFDFHLCLQQWMCPESKTEEST